MKIAITSDVGTENISGVSKNILLIKDELKKQGHEVKLFIPKSKGSKEDTEDIIRVPSLKIKKTPPFYISSVISSKMYKIFKDEDFDVIHCHTPLTMLWLSNQMSMFFDVPLLYTYHTIITDYLHYLGQIGKREITKKSVKYFERATCNPADLIICPSTKVKNRLEHFEIKTPTRVIPNGIDVGRFKNAEGGFLEKTNKFSEKDNIILTVGRIDKEKDPLFNVDVLAKVVKQIPNTKLVFAGDGKLENDVLEKAKRLGIEENIVILGHVDYEEIPNIYEDADIYLSSSTTENHSLAVIEAISAGLPAVTANDKSFTANVKNGKNGYLCDKEPEIFADKIIKILSNNKLKNKMSEKSEQLSNKFTAEKHVKNLLKVYRQAQKLK